MFSNLRDFCSQGFINFDYESEVEDDILPIFRKGEVRSRIYAHLLKQILRLEHPLSVFLLQVILCVILLIGVQLRCRANDTCGI